MRVPREAVMETAESPAERPASRVETIKADLVGIFRLSRPAPLVGDLLEEGRELAYIEALGIRTPDRLTDPLSEAGAAAASTVTASAGRTAGLAELSDATALVPAPSCMSATLCLAVASFAQGNTSRPVLTGELWNGTSGTAELTPEPPGA